VQKRTDYMSYKTKMIVDHHLHISHAEYIWPRKTRRSFCVILPVCPSVLRSTGAPPFLIRLTQDLHLDYPLQDIFTHIEVENRHFRPLCSDCRGGTPSKSIHRWTVHLWYELEFCRWRYGCKFHLLSHCYFPNLRNHAKFELIAVQGHPTSIESA